MGFFDFLKDRPDRFKKYRTMYEAIKTAEKEADSEYKRNHPKRPQRYLQSDEEIHDALYGYYEKLQKGDISCKRPTFTPIDEPKRFKVPEEPTPQGFFETILWNLLNNLFPSSNLLNVRTIRPTSKTRYKLVPEKKVGKPEALLTDAQQTNFDDYIYPKLQKYQQDFSPAEWKYLSNNNFFIGSWFTIHEEDSDNFKDYQHYRESYSRVRKGIDNNLRKIMLPSQREIYRTTPHTFRNVPPHVTTKYLKQLIELYSKKK